MKKRSPIPEELIYAYCTVKNNMIISFIMSPFPIESLKHVEL